MLHVGSGRQRELSWAPSPEGSTRHPVPFVLSQVAARCVSPHTFLPRWVVGFFSAGTGPNPLELGHVFIRALAPHLPAGGSVAWL